MTDLYKRTFLLTAADCNSQFELPLATLGQNIVETATDHANILGVDYRRLKEDGNAWVLLRMTIALQRMPRVNESYEIKTWVAGFNSRFSQRDFTISVGDEVIGQVTTTWTVINSVTRQAASLDGLGNLESVVRPEKADVGRSQRLKPADFERPDIQSVGYRVATTDIDTNRHLTAMRYTQLMVDRWPLDHYDHYRVGRFEIAYSAEARYDDYLMVARVDLTDDTAGVRISRGTETLAQASFQWCKR
ncbi:MAG: hypothetical protein LIO90_06225 [Bacteroidales bacterium]|nr:hypothetical protein [Bacteroidales bacterium]